MSYFWSFFAYGLSVNSSSEAGTVDTLQSDGDNTSFGDYELVSLLCVESTGSWSVVVFSSTAGEKVHVLLYQIPSISLPARSASRRAAGREKGKAHNRTQL